MRSMNIKYGNSTNAYRHKRDIPSTSTTYDERMVVGGGVGRGRDGTGGVIIVTKLTQYAFSLFNARSSLKMYAGIQSTLK